MNPKVRLIVGALVRLVLIFYAGWFALAPADLIGADLHAVTRAGLTILFLILAILVGEAGLLRTQFQLLMNAIRAVGSGGPAAAADEAHTPGADPKATVDILVRALRSREEGTREKAHRHLVRLTGQDLPPDADAWRRWWEAHRERFEPPS